MRKVRYLCLIGVVIAFSACQNRLPRYSKERNVIRVYNHLNDTTLQLAAISEDVEYGFTERKPIMLGIVDVHKAAENIEKYLHALRGPGGEAVYYKRLKPCCPFKTENFTYAVPFFGMEYDHKHGMLEKYNVEYTDAAGVHTVVLLFNLYDEAKRIAAPRGFTYKVNE